MNEEPTSIEETEPVLVSEGTSWPRYFLKLGKDILIVVLIALMISFLLKTFLVRSFYIPSASMSDTIEVSDRVLVNVMVPRFFEIQRGDIVVFEDRANWLPASIKPELNWIQSVFDGIAGFIGLPASDSENHIIKRVIGLGGDRVICCNDDGQIEINGHAIDEREYLNIPEGQKEASLMPFDVTVPEGYLWVLGDHRNDSADSRYNTGKPGGGFVSVDSVVGTAFVIAWPMKRWAGLDNYSEIFAEVNAEDSAQR